MKKTILFVDDDEFIGLLYKDSLVSGGFDVDIASDGVEALAKIKQSRPDLVVLDLVMPRMDGFATLKAIRNDETMQDLTVAVLSNLNQTDDEQEARRLGANDFIVKANLSPRELAKRLANLLTKS